MKKILYTLIIVAFSAFTFSSCTEEEIKPSEVTSNGGGNQSNDILK